MKIAVCLGEHGGMSFNGRRQSRDKRVTEDILSLASGGLVIAPFSAKLFDKGDARVEEDPLRAAGNGELCFLEDRGVGDAIDRVDTLIIYRWNVLYPMDKTFDVDPAEAGFRLVGTAEFSGVSHEKITREIYKR